MVTRFGLLKKTARQCLPLRRKFLDCSINKTALSLLMKHLVIGQRQKAPYFSAFHWSPQASLVSNWSAFRNHEGSTFTEKGRNKLNYRIEPNGPNHQRLQLCTAGIAWSDSDQAVRAVHSCNSWLLKLINIEYYDMPVIYFSVIQNIK